MGEGTVEKAGNLPRRQWQHLRVSGDVQEHRREEAPVPRSSVRRMAAQTREATAVDWGDARRRPSPLAV